MRARGNGGSPLAKGLPPCYTGPGRTAAGNGGVMVIKLVASDLDGTLLQNGAQALTPEALRLIGKLLERGILFAPASGRQYPNLRRMFSPHWHEMLFICENGALTMHHGAALSTIPLERETGEALMRDILARDDCEVMLSGRETSYLCPRRRSYSDFVVYTMKNTVTIVDDLFSVDEEFLKVSAYVHGDGAARVAPAFIEKWGNVVTAAVSGAAWIDFTVADKGMAIEAVARRLGIGKDEMMAFGDNFNDVEMLEAVGRPCLMETADPALLERFPSRCARVEEALAALLAEIS